MKILENPFNDGVVVSKRDYCPRKKMEKKILTRLQSGHKLAIVGDRRVGKTSTAHYVIDHIEGVKKIDVDIFHVQSPTDIAEAIIDSSTRVLDTIWDTEKIKDFIARIDPRLQLTAAGVSFDVSARGHGDKKTLNAAFNVLEETVRRSKKKVVILFDEFQAVKSVKNGNAVLKFMRSRIQKMARIPFMYVGSIRHEMEYIFQDPKSAFYKQAEVIYFDHIEPDVFFRFAARRFRKKDVVLERDVFIHLHEICNGITGDIQTFCRFSFEELPRGSRLDFEAFFKIMEKIYKNYHRNFQETLDDGKKLTKVQKNLLIQLAGEHDNLKFYSKAFQKAIGVRSPGAVSNALAALEKKGHIYKSGSSYRFANPFFREWILDYRLIIQADVGALKSGQSGTRLDFGYRQRTSE